MTLRRIAGAVLSNWTAVASAIIITFFLSPFVVHRLGDVAYGVWVLIGSTIAYMTLLDLGLRGAITHFVARHHATGDHAEATRAFSAALTIRLVMSGSVLLVTAFLVILATRLFKIPAEFYTAARWVVIFTGASLAVTLMTGVFGGVLAALHRFDLLSAITIGQGLTTAAATVVLLNSGHGIIALAAAHLCIILVVGAVTIATVRRVYPELNIGFGRPEKQIVSKLWSYSFYLVLINVAGQIVYYTDNVVVGALVSAEAVTLFAIGGRLIDYQRTIATSLAQTFMPVATGYNARGEEGALRKLLIWGTRAALLVSWPIQIVLFVRGETFIRLWMGPQYAVASTRIMRILLLSNFFIAGNSVSANVSFGLGKHKPFALWQSAEAVANLALSVVLALRMGMEGVAWGTALPSLVTQGVLWPIFICRQVRMNLFQYIWQAWIRVAVAVAPLALACIYVERTYAPKSLIQFFSQVALLCTLLPLGVIACFRKELMEQFRTPGTAFHRVALRFGKAGAKAVGASAGNS